MCRVRGRWPGSSRAHAASVLLGELPSLDVWRVVDLAAAGRPGARMPGAARLFDTNLLLDLLVLLQNCWPALVDDVMHVWMRVPISLLQAGVHGGGRVHLQARDVLQVRLLYCSLPTRGGFTQHGL